ncbi:MAG: tyrosine--tRNA ligase [Peptococcaceae bacterium]|jgi:tyrosyl-tRNA synthetase|nr:tyrosine--tRNA ligase [Peptococcaceae bacterium]
MKADVFDLLKSRGYVYQCTNLAKAAELLNGDKPVTFYLGIDPTADSLHIGHFFALMMFRHLQEAGHRGILVVGGATAMIGDPSCKSDMRKMLAPEQIRHNLEEVSELAKRFIITDGANPAIIVNNADWMNTYNFVDFMRLVGVHFNVNTMLATDAYANRLKQGGLTFLEMGYMLMQAFDFIHLYQEYGCRLQIGGSDQWGNIVAGTALRRKLWFAGRGPETDGSEAVEPGADGPGADGPEADGPENDEQEILGLTCPLLLNKDGVKMGKTESGTLWVAREKTTAYDFYQYFYNVDDADVDMLLRLFTRISLAEISELCAGDIIKAKRLMAYEITKLVHGEEETAKALSAAQALFGGGAAGGVAGDEAPESEYLIGTEGISVVDLFVRAGFAESKSEVRRLIQQNGAAVDGRRCADPDEIVTRPQDKDYVLLKKGKKSFLKVRFRREDEHAISGGS